MTLVELQEVLGKSVQTISQGDAMNEDEFGREIEKADMISRLAKQMINNADVVLRTNKLMLDGKLKGSAIEKIVGA